MLFNVQTDLKLFQCVSTDRLVIPTAVVHGRFFPMADESLYLAAQGTCLFLMKILTQGSFNQNTVGGRSASKVSVLIKTSALVFKVLAALAPDQKTKGLLKIIKCFVSVVLHERQINRFTCTPKREVVTLRSTEVKGIINITSPICFSQCEAS